MDEFKITSLLLLSIVVIDAVGDALRLRNKQILHHIAEVVVILIWMIVAKLPVPLIVMYTLARIALFDPIFNWTAGLPLKHIGNSSLYDRFLRKFAKWMREPGMLIWILRVIALAWWIAWFITNGDK